MSRLAHLELQLINIGLQGGVSQTSLIGFILADYYDHCVCVCGLIMENWFLTRTSAQARTNYLEASNTAEDVELNLESIRSNGRYIRQTQMCRRTPFGYIWGGREGSDLQFTK